MKKYFFAILIYLLNTSVLAQVTDWVRVGPKGFGIDPTNSQKRSSSRCRFIRVCYDDQQNPTIFVSTYLGIFKTTNKGDSFQPINNYNSPNWVNDTKPSDFAVHPTDPNTLVMAVPQVKMRGDRIDADLFVNSDQAKRIKIYKTTDQGFLWSDITEGLDSKVTYVNKFLFSFDGTILYACTNYGLWYRNVNSQNWVKDVTFNNENITDIQYAPNPSALDWKLYVASKKIHEKTSSNSNWVDLTSNLGIDKIFYLGFFGGKLTVKVHNGKGYDHSTNNLVLNNHVYNCLLGDLSNSYQFDKYFYIKTYDVASSTWSTFGTTTYQSIVYCPYLVNDNFGNIYWGEVSLRRYRPQSTTTQIRSVYWNHNCSSNHADIMDMHANPYTGELYVTSHGTFGVFNPDNTNNNFPNDAYICDLWNKPKMSNLPGSFCKTVSSSPFTNGELIYAMWDQGSPSNGPGGATFYQKDDVHKGIMSGDIEHMTPFFFISDKIFIGNSTFSNSAYETNPYDLSFSPNSNTCYKYVDVAYSNNTTNSTIMNTPIYQIKRGKDTPMGSFYYVDGQKMYFVQGVVNHTDITNALNGKQTLLDISINPSYSGFSMKRFNVLDKNNIIAYLVKEMGIYFDHYVNVENKILMSNNGGVDWFEISLPNSVAHAQENLQNIGWCATLSDVKESHINKFLVDSYNKNKYYIMMGALQTSQNISTIYFSENKGATWDMVFHQYADLDTISTSTGYNSNNRPYLNNQNYLLGLPTLSDGVLLPNFDDFDLNPNTGDPILVSDYGVYYKKGGFTSSNIWQKYHNLNQPRNSRYIDINKSFNKMYIAGTGGIYCGDIPCYNETTDLMISFFEHNKLYQTSEKITTSAVCPNNQTEILRAGKSIKLETGFSYKAAGNQGDYMKAFIETCSYTSHAFNNERLTEPTFTNRIGKMDEDDVAHEYEEYFGIEVYPNPFVDKVKIYVIKKDLKISKLILNNRLGQKMLEIDDLNHVNELDLSKYQGNVFLLEVIMGSERKTIKLIKTSLVEKKHSVGD